MIFHRLQRRLSDRNYGCRRRPRYLIFSQFSIILCFCQNAFASGALPRFPPGGGLQRPQLANVGSHHCRGPHRIAGPRAPRPHDPPLHKPQWHRGCAVVPSLIAVAPPKTVQTADLRGGTARTLNMFKTSALSPGVGPICNGIAAAPPPPACLRCTAAVQSRKNRLATLRRSRGSSTAIHV